MATIIQAYLLAETLRHVEEESGAAQNDPEADKQAIASALTFPERIYTRAGVLARRQGIDTAVRQTADRIRLICLIFAGVFFVIGIGATHALPEGYPAQANVVSLLALLLLPNIASMLLWLSISIISLFPGRIKIANGWLGRWVLGFHSFLERLAHAGKYTRAASRAWREFLLGTRTGRFRLTLVVHGFWLALMLGALIGCWWLMVIRQVDFVWGSTLLATKSVQSLFGTLTHWVGSFGFTVPNADDIAASRINAPLHNDELRRHWGVFILGSIITLGILPRLLAILVDAGGLLYSGKRLQLNLAHPGYARLRPQLLPVSNSAGIIDADNASAAERDKSTGVPRLTADLPGDCAWLALEYRPEQPFTAPHSVADLGIVSAYDEQRRVTERLSQAKPGWQTVCAYADLAITPDRGVVRQLTRLAEASTRPLHLVLGRSARAAAMPAADLQARREDWFKAGQAAGLTTDRIHEYEHQ